MGKLSCSVPLGFTSLTISSIFGLMSLGGRVWIFGSVELDDGSNSTREHCAVLGLWEYCLDEGCRSVFSAGGTDTVWLFAAAILQLLSASCTVFSLLAFCAVNGWEPYRRSMSVGLAALISCTVADGCLLASLVLVGHNVSFPSFIPAIFEAQLGWAYYVSTLNTLSLAVSTGMLMRYTYVIKNLPVVYEEIPDFPNDY